MELNSEQELKKLLEEGRITDAEYKQLLEAVRKNQPAPSKEQSQGGRKGPRAFSFADVPWQIWIVAVMLTLEGIGDLFTIPSYPPAAIWVLAKIVFIVGLMRRWRVVFILFQIIAGIHVLYFAAAGGWIASILNVLMMVLVFTAKDYYFHSNSVRLQTADKGA